MTNLQKRIIVGIIGIILVLTCIHYGFLPFLFFVTIMSLLALWEFYSLVKNMGYAPYKLFGMLMALFILLNFFITDSEFIFNNSYKIITNILFLILIIIPFTFSIFSKSMQKTFINISTTILGVIYIPWMLGHLIVLRDLHPHGKQYIYLVFFSIWILDTTAYFIGTKFGKNKILPSISPNKSWQGAIAGFIACVAMSLIIGQFMIKNYWLNNLIIGIILGIWAQVGDFAESLIKRSARAKDSSSIIPGHGGVLDRIDSLILTVPIVYYYLKIFN